MPLVSNEPTTCELPDLRLVGACTFADFFAEGAHALFPETWERLHQCQLDNDLLANPKRSFGLELYPQKFPQDRRWYYFACVEVKTFERVYPPNLLCRFFPAAKYLKFTIEGPVCDIGPAIQYIYKTWIPNSGVKLAGYYDMERYDERFKGPTATDNQIDFLLPLA